MKSTIFFRSNPGGTERAAWDAGGSFASPPIAASPMSRDFQIRPAILLFVLTAAAIILAGINFQKERNFQVPYDGAWWVEHGGNLVADRVEDNGPAAKAGIKEGDLLVAINDDPVHNVSSQVREMYGLGIWSKAAPAHVSC